MFIDVKRKQTPSKLSILYWYALALLLCLATDCATPIGVRCVEPRIAYQSLTANILSAERPSSFSARELMNLNLYQLFEVEPEKQPFNPGASGNHSRNQTDSVRARKGINGTAGQRLDLE
jgi:hypothetical protein